MRGMADRIAGALGTGDQEVDVAGECEGAFHETGADEIAGAAVGHADAVDSGGAGEDGDASVVSELVEADEDARHARDECVGDEGEAGGSDIDEVGLVLAGEAARGVGHLGGVFGEDVEPDGERELMAMVEPCCV